MDQTLLREFIHPLLNPLRPLLPPLHPPNPLPPPPHPQKRQKFIHGRESASGISSVSLCPNKKYIAIAEKGDTASIAVYNIRTLRKFKNLNYDKWSTKTVVNMAFSADNQLLLTLGGAPDWTLVCWNWNKAKVLSYVQVSEHSPLYQTSFCPLDASVACVSGKDKLCFYRVLDNEVRECLRRVKNIIEEIER